ncbi:MAG: hypothetical protein WC070_03650 [Candidatus Magasanikbacteria bacterium]
MGEESTQVQTVVQSKTKMAVAVGFLGLAAFAAGFAGIRTNIAKSDLLFEKSTVSTEGELNKFSITLKNAGSANVSTPFVLSIKIGENKNVIRNIKVLNPVSKDNKESYENLESENGSFDILVKNFNLARGQSTVITYWFVIPEDYDVDYLPFTYNWDSTNVVSEVSETNNTYKGKYNIVEMGLIKEKSFIEESTITDTSTSTTKVEQIDLITSTSTSSSVMVEQLPDLIIQDFTVSRTNYVGMRHFDIVLKNIGSIAAVRPTSMYQNLGTFAVQLYFISEDGSVSVSNKYFSSTINYSSLKLEPSAKLTISSDLQISDAIFNSYKKIKMKVDWLEGSIISIAPFAYPEKGYILESNEDNNELTKDLES